MTDQSSITTLPQSTYSIKEAAGLVGKSDITLVRWCRDGVLPNAGKVPGPKGDEWSIPADDLAVVIKEKGLAIHLDRSEIESDQSTDRASSDLIEALQDNAELREKTGQMTGQIDNLTKERDRASRERDQARSDLEHERTNLEQVTSELVETDKAKAVAEARVEELRTQVDQSTQDRDSLDLEHRELQKSSAESISGLSGDLESVKSEAEGLVGERDELAKKLEEAEGSMGWWTRRKYQR